MFSLCEAIEEFRVIQSRRISYELRVMIFTKHFVEQKSNTNWIRINESTNYKSNKLLMYLKCINHEEDEDMKIK